ncbi:MAG: regulatory protein GemA [Burkholderiaceae bacterium]|nr:regulatory protein GemA [Burkholderiaceae bacterium]
MASVERNGAALRRAELAQIHIAAKQLGIDRDTYEAMLHAVARVRSAGDLDWSGRKRVLEHLRPARSLNVFCKRQTGVDRIEWLDRRPAELETLTESLKSWIARVTRGADARG